MDHSAIIEILDHYFNGPPSEEDRKKIEQYRKDDPQFAATYKEYELKVEGIRAFRRAELKASLRKHLQKNPVPKEVESTAPVAPVASAKVRKLAWRQWRNIAAACLLFLTLAGTYRYQTRMDRWYTAFAPDRISAVNAGDGNRNNNFLQSEESNSAESKLEESKEYFVAGIQLAEEEESYQEAILSLQKVSSEIDYYYFWAQYEIALIHLKNKNEGEAKKQLEKITKLKGEHIAKDKAIKLLQRMNNWIL